MRITPSLIQPFLFISSTSSSPPPSPSPLPAGSYQQVDYPATNNPVDYEKYFSDHDVNATSISVFATLPIAAENLWKAAFNLNLTRFPWWYLGSDGAVAFDLIGEGDSLNHLTHALQGELGVGPYSESTQQYAMSLQIA